MNNTKKNSDYKETILQSKNKTQEKQSRKHNNSKEYLQQSTLNNSEQLVNNKTIVLDTSVNVTVELGKSKVKIKDFLRFSKGSMLILDKSIKEPLDIFINGHLIASGEIVFSENKYGVRITNIKNSLKTTNVSV